MQAQQQHNETRPLSFMQSVTIFTSIIALLLLTILGWQAEPHVPLIAAAVLTGCLLLAFGKPWQSVEQALIRGLQASVMPAMLLALIGILIAVWMMSGTVPTLLVYGTTWFQPQWFTISAMLLTVVVSMFVGSSLTTVGTFGVALVGMAGSMGVHLAIVAGAVVSGACFGDKMSPLSDTTNFASAVARVQMPDHIRNMTKTTIPAFILTCAAFLLFGSSAQTDLSQLAAMQRDISQSFHIHPLTLLPLAVVLAAAFKRLPIIITMLLGIGTGLLMTVFIQGEFDIPKWIVTMHHGFQGSFQLDEVARIVNRGGLQSMTGAISLIAIAFALGGLLQHTGVIQTMFNRLIAPVKSKEALVVTSGLSSIGVNVITGEQYMSILLPGQLFEEEYEKRGIPRLTLSRTLEDCGTLVNPLIPWGVSGAMMTSALGLTVFDYAPYAFFLWLSPLVTFAFALIPGVKRATLGATRNR
ncbi:Na+/H+ antiporter NhaC [Paenibacillus apiarius]|uniref:Na+/H+ antiporter NhaC n=1 Tax=Paenibacillus apiarius TaxID=46240 RepID=A0ABT4DPK4_9BACL|nr:Na+/H+ antiporter NhaC [Paenibacillus apiarius]MCY9514725.1 Na+/H+ antiporter NhaC [Paenibacillus apiarius]MCY9518715.1 Na+/H+ antiporter NhaC [Paenibacillus apiarius]MCY9552844.1 Na+/H+ antiporter NhaC [Paenibacillus apiarius]MCY9556869.1 Na+/H+ antiporter NhaC [Paenibacillus apiarius]MCY9686178.1 Na+/H+ antiporter NhaC [Paenibacillus apiarius]